MIDISSLNFGYDNEVVLENINLKCCKNDFLVIIGPNGGGKSTLLKIMLGLLIPKSGDIKILSQSPDKVSQKIGYVPQIFLPNSNFPIRVIEVVLMGLINQKRFGFYTSSQRQQAMKALEMVNMGKYANHKISQLSGGQKQRVYIARALCAKSEILMLDEPTASIDAKTQAEIYALLKKLNEQGVGIVLISHDANIALSFATKVAYVNKTLHIHDIMPNINKQEFIAHLAKEHSHFCDVEIALQSCSCK